MEAVGGSDGDVKSVTQVVYAECSCQAGKAPHASCKHLAAFLYALEEFSRLVESGRNRLFLVTSDPLHTAHRCQARIQRQQQMQEEWKAAHLDSSELSMDQDIHDDSAHELTPVPSECEWMDTERGDMQWYEENVVVDKAKAEEVFQSTIHQSMVQ